MCWRRRRARVVHAAATSRPACWPKREDRWPPASGPTPALALQDGARTPFAPGSFDIVTISAVLHHVPVAERAAVYAELGRVLKPGGRIYVFEHNPRNPLVRYVIARTPIDENAILLDEREVRQDCAARRATSIAYDYLMSCRRRRLS